MSIYSRNILSVGLSVRVQKATMLKHGNTILSASNKDRVIIYYVLIPLIYEHLFYEYFVHWTVGQTTKGRNVKI